MRWIALALWCACTQTDPLKTAGLDTAVSDVDKGWDTAPEIHGSSGTAGPGA